MTKKIILLVTNIILNLGILTGFIFYFGSDIGLVIKQLSQQTFITLSIFIIAMTLILGNIQNSVYEFIKGDDKQNV